jgi:hypothetical protein
MKGFGKYKSRVAGARASKRYGGSVEVKPVEKPREKTVYVHPKKESLPAGGISAGKSHVQFDVGDPRSASHALTGHGGHKPISLQPYYINHGYAPRTEYHHMRTSAEETAKELLTHAHNIRARHVAMNRDPNPSMTRKHVGGGLHVDWDMVGKKIGHASVLAGELGLAAGGVATLINPAAGAALLAVSAGAVGTGMAINHAYGERLQ